MSLKERILSAIKEIDATKRQNFPSNIKERLLSYSDVKDTLTKEKVERVIECLHLHAVALSLNEFKYTPLAINWSNDTSIGVDYILSVIENRVNNNEALSKDGVAINFSSNKKAQSFSVTAEDMKGRIHPLAWGPVGEDFSKKDFILGDQKTAISGLDIRNQVRMMTGMPSEIASKLKSVLSRIVLVEPGINKHKEFNSLWYCKKDGLGVDGNAAAGVIPVPLNSSATTNAQLSKIDSSLVPYLSNAARIGPTVKTLRKTFTNLIEENKGATKDVYVEAILAEVKKLKGNPKDNPHLRNFLNFSIKPEASDYLKIENAVDSYLRSGSMLNKNASKNKKHVGLTLAKSSKSQSKTNSESFKPSNSSPLHKVFFEEYEKSTAPQLAKKLLETAYPEGILPLSPVDISYLERIVSTMQGLPNTAEHGLNWFADIIKEKQLELIQSPKSPSVENIEKPELENTKTPVRNGFRKP